MFGVVEIIFNIVKQACLLAPIILETIVVSLQHT